MEEKDTVITINWCPDKQSSMPVYVQIVRYFYEKVSKGDWTTGEKVPAQRALAEQFNVNRSTIVTAMEELLSYGIITTGYGGGTRIAGNTWSMMLNGKGIDWDTYIKAGTFQENQPAIQIINQKEFEPGIIRLGTGELAPELFPRTMWKKSLNNIMNRVESLNYLEPLGLCELRKALAKHLGKRGMEVSPESILITSGSLQALQLISVCMLQKGSTVYTEAPSYLKSLQVFQSAGMKLSGVPVGKDGMEFYKVPYQTEDKKDCLLYTIPTFHNPTGTVMSTDNRKRLLEFGSKHRIPIIEDGAYEELWYDRQPPKSIKSMDQEGLVLYLGTISKTLAPGLRIGWLVGPESVVKRLGDVKMQMDYGASSVSQWILTEFLESGMYDEHLKIVREQLRLRRDKAIRVLRRYLGDLTTFYVPEGGFYVWVRLKLPVDIQQVFHRAMEQNVLINPGEMYDFTKNDAMRISYAYVDSATFEKGIRILADIIKKWYSSHDKKRNKGKEE